MTPTSALARLVAAVDKVNRHKVVKCGAEKAYCRIHNVYVDDMGRCHALDELVDAANVGRLALDAAQAALGAGEIDNEDQPTIVTTNPKRKTYKFPSQAEVAGLRARLAADRCERCAGRSSGVAYCVNCGRPFAWKSGEERLTVAELKQRLAEVEAERDQARKGM